MRFVIKKTNKRDLEKLVRFGTCSGEREGSETRSVLATIPFGPYVLSKPVPCWPDELVAEYRDFSKTSNTK